MKNKTIIIILITIFSLLGISLTILLISMLNNNYSFSKFNINKTISSNLVINETYHDYFKEINITSTASDIYINVSEDNEFKVLIYGDKDKTYINNEDNVLLIKSDVDTCIGFCLSKTISKIELTIPAEYANLINIENNYGDIKVGSLPNSIININADCGDITIKEANQVDINNDYGNTTINNVVVANIASSCGDISIDTASTVDITNDYGDISINYIDSKFTIKEDCGNVTIKEINITSSSSVKNDFGNITIGKTNDIRIDAETDLGNTKIAKNNYNSDITLTLENDCGDITVNN